MSCSAAPGAEYYERCYADYAAQNPDYKLRYYRSLVGRYAPDRDGIRVVDVGCAFGDFLSGLPGGWKRTGVDTNAFAIDAAGRRFPDVRFACTGEFGIPEREVDVLTAFDVLEHVPDLHGALECIDAALAQDGILVMVVPVYDGPLGPLVHALDKDPTHVHKRSRKFWRDLIGGRFDLLHCEGVLRYLLPKVGRYVHIHSGALTPLAPAVALVARKKRTAA